MNFKKHLCTLLVLSTICSNIPAYEAEQVFAHPITTNALSTFATTKTGISITKSGDTVTILDTETTKVDYPGYFTNSFFSDSDLALLTSAANLEIKFTKEVTWIDSHFLNSSSLKKVSFYGPKITFKGLYTSPASNLTDLTFHCPVNLSIASSNSPSVTYTLKGNGNTLGYFFTENSGSLVVDGATTFDFGYSGSSYQRKIKNITINAPITFPNANTFLNAVIDTMNINVDPATAFTINDGASIFKNSTINNLYLNYTPSTSTPKFSLAPNAESPLVIGSIYFTNPDYNYFNLDLSNLTGLNGSSICLYGYGGISAYDTSKKPVLSQSMYREMTSDTVTYTNYMVNYQLDKTTLPSTALLKKGETSTVVSFENIDVTGTFLDVSNPTSGNTYNHKLKKKSAWDTTQTSEPQYQYGIYVPEKYNPDTNSEFTYTADNETYTLLQSNSCNFDAGTHTYYIEAGGNFQKCTLTVSNSRIEKIVSATLNTPNVEVGKSLSNDDVTVKVCYTNDETEYTLSSNEFTLENPQITKEGDKNTVTVIVPRQGSGTPLSTTLTVNGYVDNITGFEVECNITEKPANSTLSVGNITLKNITYGDPNKATTETLNSGYSFVSNGTMTNTIKILPGLNKISVCYGSYIKEDAIIINGYTAEAFDTVCDYQTMYVGTSLFKSNVVLKNVVYNNADKTRKSSVKDGSFDFVVDGQIVPNVTIKQGTNVIGISYDGKTIADAITIQGIEYDLKDVKAEYVESYLVDGVAHAKIRITITHQDGTVTTSEIDNLTYDTTYQFKTNENNEPAIFYQGMEFTITDRLIKLEDVQYLGDATDTSYVISDFYISATYASGTTKNTQSNPEILSYFSSKVKSITPEKRLVALQYQADSTDITSATVELNGTNQVVAVSMDDEVTSPDTATATPTAVPDQKPDSSQVPGTPKPTAPENTESPSAAPATVAPTESPAVTDPTTTTAPVKGKTYKVGALKYKVTSLTKTGGTVMITGYVKSASKISLPSTVKIYSHKMKVTAIAGKAFQNCQKLKGSITMPVYVTSIGDKAFYKCKNITKIVLNPKLRSIGASGFQYCTKLKYVNFYNCKLKKVGKKAFFNNAKKRKFNMYNSQMSYYKKLLKYKKQFN